MAQSQSNSKENEAKDGSVKVHIGPEVVCDDVENVRNEIKFNCCKCTSKKVNFEVKQNYGLGIKYFQNPLSFAFGFCLGAFIDCDVCCCLDSATKTAKFANQSIKLFFTISVVAVTAGGISAGNILL